MTEAAQRIRVGPGQVVGRQTDRVPTGILLMVCAVFLFAANDTVVKYLSQHYPVLQIVWARYAFHMLFMLPVLVQLGPRRLLSTGRPGLQVLRAFLLLASTLLFFTALRFIPLAQASSIGFVGPLLVTAMSALLLKERVGPRRWTAVVVGFIGVLVIIRPGFGMAHWAASLPLFMALCFAVYQIVTRILTRTEDASTTLFWTGGIAALAMSAIVPFAWTQPDAAGWALLACVGLLGALSHWLMIKAYERAPASILAPYNYTNLFWTIPIGYVVFGDVPDAWMLSGAAIVIACGLYVWWRERQLARIAAASAQS